MIFLKRSGFLLSCGAFGQEARGTIGGRVTDPQDAGIPGASVVITNIETGVGVTLATNDKGVYVAPLLLPGQYQLAAEHYGFKRSTRNKLTLNVHDDLQIDVRLEMGSVSESVTVTESAPVLESTSASISMLLGTKELTDLPITHGNPYQLIALAPGTTFEGDMLLNRPSDPTHSVDYSMGGSASGTTDFTLDGVSNTTKGSSQGKVAAGYVPPVDAIGEVRIETNLFDARTGQTSGGMVNISLKSGTNKLHGSGAFVKMKPEWFANNFFSNRSGAERGDFDYNRWSGSLSGPVYIPHGYNGKNRTFFMWAYEALQQQRPQRRDHRADGGRPTGRFFGAAGAVAVDDALGNLLLRLAGGRDCRGGQADILYAVDSVRHRARLPALAGVEVPQQFFRWPRRRRRPRPDAPTGLPQGCRRGSLGC